MEHLTADLDAIADRMGPLPNLHAKGGLGACGGHQGALLERSGIAGRSNPLAAPVQWVIDDDGITRGWATYSAAYEGPIGSPARRVRGCRVRRPARLRADGVRASRATRARSR